MTNCSTILYDAHDRVGPWVAEGARVRWDGSKRAIGLERGGELIAGLVYEDFNGASLVMHQRIDNPRAITRAFVHSVFAYPFIQLGCQLVIGFVISTNERARRLDEHLGFVLSGTLPDAHPDGDILIYTMRRDQCRFLSWSTR